MSTGEYQRNDSMNKIERKKKKRRLGFLITKLKPKLDQTDYEIVLALTANPTSNRSRLSNETLNANFLLSNDKYKSSNSMLRQTRPSLTTTTMPSIYLPTQSLQKSIQPASKSRLQQEKSTPSKGE